MSKVIFVGDVHLKGSTPISRKDNYPETILNKLRFVFDYAKSIDSKHVFFLGDIFDTVNISIQYFSHCLSVFKQARDAGISLYTLAGNHDIRYDAIETLPITPLGILIKSGAIELLDSVVVDNTFIRGCHFPSDPVRNDSDLYSILLLHRFYESGFNEVPITKEDTISLGYNTYILGHDHKPYVTQFVECGDKDIRVIRPGSLARNSSEQYNRLRKPRILIFDTDTKHFSYEEVKSESGLEIFFEKEESLHVESMADVVEYLRSSYHSSDTSIRDYVKDMVMPDDVKSVINTYLNILGA